MADTGPPQEATERAALAARLAEAEQRLAVYERFRAEQLGVLSEAIDAAERIRLKAEADATAFVDRARVDTATIDAAVARLRESHPIVAKALAGIRGSAASSAPPATAGDPRAELETARKRLALYESFEDTIESVLTTALRAAQEIRTRSEEEAAATAERLRTEQRGLRDELGQLRGERDSVAQVVAGLQQARDGLLAQRAQLEETAAGLRDEIERLRASSAAESKLVEQRRAERADVGRAAKPVAQERADAPHDREAAAALRRELDEDIERLRGERAAMARERDYQSDEVTRLRGERDAVANQLVGLREAFAAAVSQLVRTVGQAPLGAPQPVEAPAPAPAPQPAAPAAAPLAAEGEIRIVISPVASFSELVSLERRLNGLAGVRSVYVRDLRGGTATLAVNVGGAASLQDFADQLARQLDASIERVADGVIELKIRTNEAGAPRAQAG